MPKLMFGTKWPSITSRCSAVTPAASTAFTSRSKWAKSLAKIDGNTAGAAARSRAFNSSRRNRIAIQLPEGATKQRERAVNAGMPAIHQRIVLRKLSRCSDERTPKRSVPHGRRLLKACFAPDAPETPGATGQPANIVTGEGFFGQRHGTV